MASSPLSLSNIDVYDVRLYGYIILSSVILFAIYRRLWTAPRFRGPLPPGLPAGWMKPGVPMFRCYDDLIQSYGPVASVVNGGKVHIVIGTYQAAQDIMQKRGSELADRPPAVSANDILSGGKRILMLGVGKRMNTFRKALHASLQSSASQQYELLQYSSAKAYVLDILRAPDSHLQHAKKYAASVVLSLAYGKTTPTTYSDPEVIAINKGTERLMHTIKHIPLPVDKYPFLRYLPLPHVRNLRRYHREELQLYTSQVETAKRGLANQTADPCFTGYLLEHQEEFQLSNDEVAYLAGSMFGAGSDTTGSGLGIITMAAACHPEEQAKVQAQIDAVVGSSRVPNFEDFSALPLVAAFAMESHRWRPITPVGFNHRATKDIVWNGYVIPAGASVTGSHWSIMHDPAVFPDPETFRQERWLTKDGTVRDDLKHFDFGFGRRVCPGIHVAERSLFMTTAQVLWAFNISEDPSAPIDTFGFTDAPITHPLPFKVNFIPRFTNLQQIVEAN